MFNLLFIISLCLVFQNIQCGMTYFKRRIQTPPTTKLNSTKHRAMLLLIEPGRSKSEIWQVQHSSDR